MVMAQGSSVCPRYHQAVELLGRRWAGAIIRLLLSGPCRYNELRARIPDISDRMLAERLKELESEGVVARTVLPEAPIGVEYALTEKGKALEVPVMEIGKWAEKWLPVPAHSKTTPASGKLSSSRRR
jgi:DNA-binding HxlR family transcriptional regulator